jgi:hypothetical protein
LVPPKGLAKGTGKQFDPDDDDETNNIPISKWRV